MHELLLQLKRIAVAFALTRCKLSLLYRSDSTTDFGLPDMMARREASILNESMASFPQP